MNDKLYLPIIPENIKIVDDDIEYVSAEELAKAVKEFFQQGGVSITPKFTLQVGTGKEELGFDWNEINKGG